MKIGNVESSIRVERFEVLGYPYVFVADYNCPWVCTEAEWNGTMTALERETFDTPAEAYQELCDRTSPIHVDVKAKDFFRRACDGWRYQDYWDVVLGARKSPSQVVREYSLSNFGSAKLADWIEDAELRVFVHTKYNGRPDAQSMAEFREQAIEELREAIESLSDP